MTTLPQSRVHDPMDAPAIRWGILGTGWIAAAFADAVRECTRSTLAVVGSRDAERAAGFARDHGVEASVGSYEELVAGDVDVIYVASPHSEHHAHALLALNAGKPVLVEKAFTRNAAEAAEVVALARTKGLFCMEAMWSRFLPHYDVVRQLIADGHLGDIRFVAADHGQLLWPDGPRRMADPALAGGALLDLGIYPVSFAHMVLGGLTDVKAVGTLTDQGVDANTGIVATGPGGGTAALGTTMAAGTPTTAVVAGNKARIEIEEIFYAPSRTRLVAPDDTELGRWEDDLDVRHLGLRYEAAEVARCLAAGTTESALMPLDETVEIMRVLDEVRAQVGVRFPGEGD